MGMAATQFRTPSRMVTIGEAARICNLTLRAIRLYEEKGLVASVRDMTGARLYDEAALDCLAYIARARRAGLGVADVLKLVEAARREGPEVEAARRRELCKAQLATLEAQQRDLERFMAL